MITFNEIKWKNFLSTGNQFTYIPLDKNKTTLIMGKNGSGKSTLLDAITFCLFNKPFRNINKPQLVNSITKKDCLVELSFTKGGSNFLIKRGIKPNIFEIYQDGELLNQDSENKDYQEYFEEHILKLNYKTFCQVVILGSASFVPFMQLPAQKRREIVEDLLDLQIFSAMNDVYKIRSGANKDKIRDTETNIKNLESQIDIAKEYSKKATSIYEETIKSKLEEIEELKEQIVDACIEKEKLEDELKMLDLELSDTDDVSAKLSEVQKVIYNNQDKINRFTKELKFYEINDDCPTCGQEIQETTKQNKKEELQEKINRSTSTVDTATQLQEKYTNKLNENKEKEKQKSANGSRLYYIINDIKSKERRINVLTEEIKKPHDTQVVDYSHLENQLTEAKEELSKATLEKTLLASVGVMLKDSGIKARIIKQYIPIINQQINKYLSSMEFFINFEIDENFEETVNSNFKDTFTYTSFSEGEKARVDLALLFTWRSVAKMRNSINTNLLILDEVFDGSLDGNGAEELFNILEVIAENSNVFVISHKDLYSDKFENILEFKKNKQFSNLHEGL